MDSKIMVKVTIVGAETPDLFAAMSGIKDLRRRSTRIRDLASKGLLAERGGGAVQAPSSGQPTLASVAKNATRVSAGDTVDSMLNWGTEDQ